MAVETSGGVSWVRRNGRLTRVEIKVEEEDLAVIGVENQVAIEKLIVQKTVRRKSVVLRGKIPLEIQMMIFDHISIEDVKNMVKTCKAMEEFVNVNFVVSVILPLSVENQKLLAGRYVLDLTSSVTSAASLKVWMLGEFYGMVKNMNLIKLKRLKFNGPNFGIMEGRYQGLNRRYLTTLEHILIISKYLQSVDILIDKSVYFDVHIISRVIRLSSLKEVTLRSSGDMGLGRIIWKDRINPRENPSMTVNKMLEKLFKNEGIEKLALKGLSVPWDGQHSYLNTFQLVIKSKSLQSLSIEHSKFFKIGNIEAENLKEIDMDMSDWNEYLTGMAGMNICPFVGAWDDKMERILPLLDDGCPILERFNELKIQLLKDVVNDGDWLKELRNHKGSGDISGCEGNYCSVCL